MVRILKPETLDREEYPFAKMNCSLFILLSSNERFLFEASSPDERDWFVYGLKLVVARLASMVIVGDDQMFVEFFSPWAHSPLQDSDFDGKDISRNCYANIESCDGAPLFASTNGRGLKALWGTEG
jgi:hypothetical protein